MKSGLSRRSLLRYGAAACAGAMHFGSALELAFANAHPKHSPERSLKELASRGGRLVGVFSGQHELMTDPIAARTIATEFNMLAIGNDLKMNRIHPAPDTYDFSYGDYDLDWSKRNGLLFRGHTLVWHNALPTWFRSYVNKSNAEHVMTDHITAVMKYYAGKMYSWDVVNEPVRNIDGRPDGLRAWPWLQPIGPEYIEIAFRTAAAADPKAKLFLNENNFEHDLPLHTQRRETLLQLLTNLKKKNVPITGLGTQAHLRADVPLATAAVKQFFTQVRDMGLEIMITEFDVDDTNIPDAQIDAAVARRYAEYLDLVGPFAKAITFEHISDDAGLPKRPGGLMQRPNLFDVNYQKKPAYVAAADSLATLPKVN